MRFVVIENTPGYLPDDDDPPTFDEYADAVEYLNERAAEYADDESGVFTVEYGLASSGNYAAVSVHDSSKSHDLGRWIAVELDESEEEDPRPEESDGYVNEPAYGSCVVSLDGKTIGTAESVPAAFRILARSMVDASYFPNVWHVNERGNTTLVSLDLKTGAYRFTDTAYV